MHPIFFFRFCSNKGVLCLTTFLTLLSVLPVSSLAQSQTNNQVNSFDHIRSFNVLVLEDFEGYGSDVQGKLAAGGNIHLNRYAIADKEPSQPAAFHLVAGGILRFDNGRLYTGSASGGTSIDGVAQSVIYALEAEAIVAHQAPDFSFSSVARELHVLSERLQQQPDTGTAELIYSTLTLHGNCLDEAQVFSIDLSVLERTSQIKTRCLPDDKTIVINITGNNIQFGGKGLSELARYRRTLLWNFMPSMEPSRHGAHTLKLQHIGIEGSILAPSFDLEVNSGVVHGSVFAKSWSGTMQVNRYLFSGHFDFFNKAPVIQSSPVTSVDEDKPYTYQMIVSDEDQAATNGTEKLHFRLAENPEGMIIDTDTGLITWLPDSEYVGSVDAMNDQCYLPMPGALPPASIVQAPFLLPDLQPGNLAIQTENNRPQLVVSVANRGLGDVTEPLVVNFYHHPTKSSRLLVGSVPIPSLTAGQSRRVAIDVSPGQLTGDISAEVISSPDTFECDDTNNVILSPVVQAMVTDQAGESDRQRFIINVLDVNEAPLLEGDTTLETGAGESLVVDYKATDGDTGDAIRFTLIGAPPGLSIDPRSGRINIKPNTLSPGNTTFEVLAEDLRGGISRLLITLKVTANEVPAIVSSPLTRVPESAVYHYDVEAVDPNPGDVLHFTLSPAVAGLEIVSTTGEIRGDITNLATEHALYESGFCRIEQDDQITVVGAADIFISIDESASMSGEQEWLRNDAMPFLEEELKKRGVGAQDDNPNLYGLTGFGYAGELFRPFNQNGVYQMGIDDFQLAAAGLVAIGGREDGYAGMKLFLAEPYQFRPERAHNLLVITDEDRDLVDGTATKAFLLEAFANNNVILNAVVDADFACTDGRKALGMDALGRGYIAEAGGNYTVCDRALVEKAMGTTETDYIDLVVTSGGAAWDLGILRQGGDVARSFSKAFAEVKIKEIIRQLPPLDLPELVIFNLRYDEQGQQLQVDVRNQGLADAKTPIEVVFYLEDQQAGLASLSALGKNQQKTLTLNGITIDPVKNRFIRAELKVGNNKECLSQNNNTTAAIVRVRATDPGGLWAQQTFSVNRADINDPPYFISPTTTETVAGEPTVITHKVADPDSGDLFNFTLINPPEGITINGLTGVMTVPALNTGVYVVTVQVSDSAGHEVSQEHMINVSAENDSPSPAVHIHSSHRWGDGDTLR